MGVNVSKPGRKEKPRSQESLEGQNIVSSEQNQLALAVEKMKIAEKEIERLKDLLESKGSGYSPLVGVAKSRQSISQIVTFDEQMDDDEVIKLFFAELDLNKNGTIQKEELLVAIETYRDQSDVSNGLNELLQDSDGRLITFDVLRDMLRKIPRICGQRVQWARSLGLDRSLARHVRAGTLFDGLAGLRAMSQDEVEAACAAFAADVTALVHAKWLSLRALAVLGDKAAPRSEAEEANGKFAMTEGAVVGAFASLDDFYRGPEALIGYPNPKLLPAMKTEHCRRANATHLFVTPNYGLCTCPDWEWYWVVDAAAAADSPTLPARLASAGGRFPGEVGDAVQEVDLGVSVRLAPDLSAEAAAAAARNLGEDLGTCVAAALLTLSEERCRGVRVTEPPALRGSANLLTARLALPQSSERFAAAGGPEAVAAAARMAACAAVAGADVELVGARAWVYCSFVNGDAVRRRLAERRRTVPPAEWAAILRNEFRVSIEELGGPEAAEAAEESVVQAFDRETAALRAAGTLRRQVEIHRNFGRDMPVLVKSCEMVTYHLHQGRLRGGAMETLLDGNGGAAARLAGLLPAEAGALRLYTGPMYLLYNARLRGFPKAAVDGLAGNRYETTIFVITSAITKLSKVPALPPHRLLARGLGGMLLPPQFWRPAGPGQLQGGVEYGLMSTTSDRRVAVHYSGLDRRRAIVFEILAGRVDVGASVGFLSQYPGEEEFLMPPLCCLEVLGGPRVEVAEGGQEVVFFPMRVNVNLKSPTVEQACPRE